jgi:hypothetical protein
MIFSIKFLVFVTYVLAVYLDFFSQQKQFQNLFFKKEIANAYVIRNKLALVSRGFAFAIAPALGFLALNVQYIELFELFLICSFAAVFFISISFYIFNKNYSKVKYLNSEKTNKETFFNERFMGYIAFGVAINAPFVLNILAAADRSNGLWLVQLAPIITAFSTAYIVFFYDTRLASILDSDNFYFSDAKKFLEERLVGRVLAFILVLCAYIAIL